MYDSAMSYTRRIIDDLLDEVIGDLAAIALEGAKGVGKTATARRRARSELSMDVASQRALVAGNVRLVRNLEPPVLIDEWQLEPQVWDAVRRAVDDDRTGGQFLLTGSAGVGAYSHGCWADRQPADEAVEPRGARHRDPDGVARVADEP